MGSPHTVAARAAEANLLLMADPGDAGKIVIGGKLTAYVGLVTAGAETRTLKDPSSPGQTITLGFRTDGGDCVVTTSTACNQAGNNTLTFADAGDILVLTAMKKGTSLEWRITANDGVALSTV